MASPDSDQCIGGDHVSIADVRLACSLEFLIHAIDYAFPGWTKASMSAVETALGEPMQSRRGRGGYIAYAKGNKG